ncbi:ComEA family DNA-binding protein [Galenea microaerophila]
MKIFVLILGVCFPSWVFASPVNINSAFAEQLASSLSGIGPKKAEAIVAYRKAHGPFKSADDLSQVKGIGSKTIAKNAQDILLKDSETK